MHVAVFLSAALAALGSANPLVKRSVVPQPATGITTATGVVSELAPASADTSVGLPRANVTTLVNSVNVSATAVSTISPPDGTPEPAAPPQDTRPFHSLLTLFCTSYKNAVLDAHNGPRARHGVPPLVWDEELFGIAVLTARSCKFELNTTIGSGGYGQNIAAGGRAIDIHEVILQQFYGQAEYYRWYGSEPDFADFHMWGNFAQMVWKDTTAVGCWTRDCNDRPELLSNVASNVPPHFTVCNYRKNGKVVGQFAANVLAPRSG